MVAPQHCDRVRVLAGCCQVAILCNHQRSVPKTHEAQMGKVQEKLDAASAELEQLQEDYKLAVKGKAPKDGRKIGNPEG